MWGLWAQLPARRNLSEREISALLDVLSPLKDAAQLRRTLIEARLVTRTRDGAAYTRIEAAPPPEAAMLLAELGSRKKAA